MYFLFIMKPSLLAYVVNNFQVPTKQRHIRMLQKLLSYFPYFASIYPAVKHIQCGRNVFIVKLHICEKYVVCIFRCKAFYPEKRTVGYAYVDFRELANMNGTVNVTTPFERFNYTGANFRTETNA